MTEPTLQNRPRPERPLCLRKLLHPVEIPKRREHRKSRYAFDVVDGLQPVVEHFGEQQKTQAATQSEASAEDCEEADLDPAMIRLNGLHRRRSEHSNIA